MSSQRTGKWIEAPSADTPAVEVAREVLRMRVEHVERMLPLAAHQYHNDVEHVHRLRVGCRRAGIAVSAFRSLLPGKVKPLRRWLKRLRRAAGPAREVDVLVLDLRLRCRLIDEDRRQGNTATDQPLRQTSAGIESLQEIIGMFERRRKQVQRKLVSIDAKTKQGQLHLAVERCLDSCTHNAQTNQTSFGHIANSAMAEAVEELFEVGSLSNPSIDQLHRLRLVVKRMRYSIELFHSVLSKSLRAEIYPQIENLQRRLGALNDHQTAQGQFQQLLAKLPPCDTAVELARLVVQEHRSATEARDEFLQWWTNERIGLMHADLDRLIRNDSCGGNALGTRQGPNSGESGG